VVDTVSDWPYDNGGPRAGPSKVPPMSIAY
jgi:hypothetical protein